MKKDNCKDCVSKCEHAGKDREFVCIGGVSCKVEEAEDKVSVVRCKDCMWWHTKGCVFNDNCVGGLPSAEDFCSQATRKKELTRNERLD